MKRIKPPIKSQGSKYHLSQWIIDNFPENYEKMTYCEPFCSGSSILLNKECSLEKETIIDIDKGIISILKSLRDEPKEFIRRIKRINYSDRTFARAQNKAKTDIDDYVDKGINEYILRRMSRGGLKKSFSNNPNDINSWDSMIEQLLIIAKRLKKTDILISDFKDVIKIWDDENNLFYFDPPNLTNDDCTEASEFEMPVDDHVTLLSFMKTSRSKIIISGYMSPLYNRHLGDEDNWTCIKKDAKNSKKTDCIWINY